jgi:hypothetical protein
MLGDRDRQLVLEARLPLALQALEGRGQRLAEVVAEFGVDDVGDGRVAVVAEGRERRRGDLILDLEVLQVGEEDAAREVAPVVLGRLPVVGQRGVGGRLPAGRALEEAEAVVHALRLDRPEAVVLARPLALLAPLARHHVEALEIPAPVPVGARDQAAAVVVGGYQRPSPLVSAAVRAGQRSRTSADIRRASRSVTLWTRRVMSPSG